MTGQPQGVAHGDEPDRWHPRVQQRAGPARPATSLPDGLAGVDDWHLVVVDGASTDGTVDLVRRTAPEVTCVDLAGPRLRRRGRTPRSPPSGDRRGADPQSPGAADTGLRQGDARRPARAGAGIVVPRCSAGPASRTPHCAAARLCGPSPRRSRRQADPAFRALSESIADPARYRSGTGGLGDRAVTMMSRERVTRAGPWDEELLPRPPRGPSRVARRRCRVPAGVRRRRRGPSGRGIPGGAELCRCCANRVRLYGMRDRRAAATLFWVAMLLASRSARRAPIHRAADGKLIRERRAIIAGFPVAAGTGISAAGPLCRR